MHLIELAPSSFSRRSIDSKKIKRLEVLRSYSTRMRYVDRLSDRALG